LTDYQLIIAQNTLDMFSHNLPVGGEVANLFRVLTSLENLDNLEISGNFVTLEISGKTQGI